MSRSSRQLTLHDFCFRYNNASRSRSPCAAQHVCCSETPAEHWSIESSDTSVLEDALPLDVIAQPAVDGVTGFHVLSSIASFTYDLWQCRNVDDRVAYQAVSFWARSDSRWHARDLKMWDTAPQNAEEHAESESATFDPALPDSEEDTVYATLPRRAG